MVQFGESAHTPATDALLNWVNNETLVNELTDYVLYNPSQTYTCCTVWEWGACTEVMAALASLVTAECGWAKRFREQGCL